MKASVLHPDETRESLGFFERIAVGVSNWSERWFPDSYIFAAIAVVLFLIMMCFITYFLWSMYREERGR